MSTVEFRGVGKVYGGNIAIRGLSLKVESGELVSLLGPSGCGKTTTLNLLAGFIRPDSGTILINGRSVEGLPAHRRNAAMVFQGYALFPHLTVGRNVAFGLDMRSTPAAERDKRVRETLALVKLEDMADRLPRQLSGGQQQRVAIARALAVRPDVLLLDEPLSNLDANLREEMRSEIRAVQKLVGITAVYVTHDQEEALAISDRVVLMNQGSIEQIGTPKAVYQEPATVFAAAFVGAANIIPAKLESVEGKMCTVLSRCGTRFRARRAEGAELNDVVSLVVRPEHMGLSRTADNENSGRVLISRRIFVGPTDYVTAQLGEVAIRMRIGGLADHIAENDEIYVHFSPDHALIVRR